MHHQRKLRIATIQALFQFDVQGDEFADKTEAFLRTQELSEKDISRTSDLITLVRERMSEIEMDESVNVFDDVLQTCSEDPPTGFFRDGCCNTSDQDTGSHTICIEVTEKFLEYSRFRGNDLSTPLPEFGFPGAHMLVPSRQSRRR